VLREVPVVTSFEAAWQHAPFDWIGLTMKANDTTAALMQMQQVLGFDLPDPFPPVVSFQNGIGSEASVEAAFGEGSSIAATVTTPVSLPEVGYIIEEKARGIGIATQHPRADAIAGMLEGAGFAVQREANPQALLWSKLLLNVVGNASSAILDMPPGEVYAHKELAAMEQDMLREIIAIMELADIQPVNLPGVPARRLATLARLPRWVFRPVMRAAVSRGRGEKLPSLLLALRAGKQSTEAPFLNGAVAQKADALERIVPVNHTLALTVSDIATGRAPWEVYRCNPDMLLTAVRVAKGMGSR
jgi:2-dehydropantoate 2-reductase